MGKIAIYDPVDARNKPVLSDAAGGVEGSGHDDLL
jgi:hypothetical protein